jgi:23S rRNA (pseudouridine1915-N3)-methyltransferase
MLLTLTHIGPKAARSGARSGYDALTRMYLERIQPYHSVKSDAFPTEAGFLEWLPRQQARLPACPVLLDSTGRQLSSTDFAAWLGDRRDRGEQHIVFAIGPPDGWSGAALSQIRARPHLLLSFGPMTLAHELARLVLAEQLYRACTILAGHPYHSGH